MKKIIILITVLFFFKTSFSQYPNGTQTIGNDSNVVQAKGGFRGRVINWTYTDTASANLERIKGYPGAQIFTTADTALWFRSPGANKWVQMFSNTGGASGDTLVWKLSGNTVGSRQATPVLGTLDGYDLNLMTDGSTRLVIPQLGITRNMAAVNKYLLYDTITKRMYFGDGGGGSSSGWELTGNAGTTAGTNFIGTTDAVAVVVKANNTERMRVLSGGNVGIGTSTPTHKFQVFGGASKFDSTIISNGTSDEDYMIRHRTAALAFPIVTFKPIIDNKNIAFDIMPRGAPGNYSDNGIAWMDVCDTDVSDGAGAVGTARIGISTTAVEFGSRAFSGASAKPVNINVNTDTRITLSTSNTATFNIGKITQSQSVNADYVGYSLLNTNNTGVGSDAIMFIGNDFGTSRFGFLRWNNNAAVATAALRPNSLQIATNDGATGGIAFGAFGGNGKFTWSTGSGVLITEKMRLDSAGNLGIGTSTPDSLLTVQNGFWAKRGVRLSGLASSANATDSMMVVNTSNGAVGYRAIPSGGGSTSPAGNFGNLQIGRNGAFATPGSDSLDWESSTGLTSKGNVNITTTNNQLSMFDGTAFNTSVNPITWGTNYNEPALLLYDGGATDQYLWGLRAGNMQFAVPNNGKFSVNHGGTFNASGTNEMWKADYNNLIIQHNLKTSMNSVRFLKAQGADVASTAGVMTLGTDGNTFEITGTNSITAILSTNWQNGSEVTLVFTSTATLVDGTANSGSDIGFELAGNTNFVASAGAVVTVVLAELGGTQRWREKSRSVN